MDGYIGKVYGVKVVDINTFKKIMNDIKNKNFPKSKQVEIFISEVLEHFEDERTGQ